MKFKCPYCKHEFGPDPLAQCPKCRKAMLIPNRLQKNSLRDRKRAKKAIWREAEMKRAAMFVPSARFGRQPSFLIFGLAALIVVGGLMLSLKMPVSPLSAPADPGWVSPDPGESAGRSVDALRIAVERFRRDCGRYPETREGLSVLLLDPGLPGWRSAYIRWLVCDPWGNPYFYECTNGTVTVVSRGPDGVAGTADDILPREPAPESVNWDISGSGPASPPPTNPLPLVSSPEVPSPEAGGN